MGFSEGNFETWALYASLFYGILLCILLVQWIISFGILRGILSWLCRVGWTVPMMTTLFPRIEMEPMPRSLSMKPVRILLDDSSSMRTASDPKPLDQGNQLIETLQTECLRIGCILKTTRLSELDPTVKLGLTSLNGHLDSWILQNPQDPWVLITDGGDSQPTEPWKPSLKGSAKNVSSHEQTPRGLIVGFAATSTSNIWIKAPRLIPFSFENKPLPIKLIVGRNSSEVEEIIQVQVGVAPQPPTTLNVTFKPHEDEVQVNTVLPSLPRGQHLVEMSALPTASEQTLWDNTTYAPIEVLPNTFGVLHLLGSPSWDGRFLRRYLKGEPKYDLISFFILRDPWDSQQVNERELSLIPFPVERLFKEELPNFRVVIIQNFTLFQFLLPEYQNNLVKFVQDGGGLLFMGGPRALLAGDLMGSPLKSILPFEIDEKNMPFPNLSDADDNPWDSDWIPNEGANNKSPIAYDPQVNFRIELAKPDAQKRALANVYDDWENMQLPLTRWNNAQGLHRMEGVRFKERESTTLLHAIPLNKDQSAAKKIPLAVASYPGKGRALWIFTDSLWRLGMTMNQDVSRQTYNNFIHSSMTWLMRQDLKKPLIIQDVVFSARPGENPRVHASLQGPAARFFDTGQDWNIKVCGQPLPHDRIALHRRGENEIDLSAPLSTDIPSGKLCDFAVEGHHPAFGSVKTSMTAVFPETYRDSLLQPVPHRLRDLASLSEAQLLIIDPRLPASSSSPKDFTTENPQEESPLTPKSWTSQPFEATKTTAVNWLHKVTETEGVALPTKFRTLKDFYWIFKHPIIYLVFILVPLEILIRRWDQIVPQKYPAQTSKSMG